MKLTPKQWTAVALAIVGAILIAVGGYYFSQSLRTAEAQTATDVATLFNQHPELEEIMWFNNESKGWLVYVRDLEPKHLHEMEEGQPYLIVVNSALTLNGLSLSCRTKEETGRVCFNLVTWPKE